MTVSDLVAYVHVADVSRSIEFYELLGLEVKDSHGDEGELAWCWLEADDARLMLGKAGEPVNPYVQAVMFYAYTQDLPALRERLIEAGVDAGEIEEHTAGPRLQLRLSDPDGYTVFVGEISAARAQAAH